MIDANLPIDTFVAARRLLAQARGRHNAMTLAAIAQALGISRRKAETLLEENLQYFPFVLVADGSGYYQPSNAGELNAYIHSLHSRHRKMQIREATVRRKARAAGWPEHEGRFTRCPPKQGELFA